MNVIEKAGLVLFEVGIMGFLIETLTDGTYLIFASGITIAGAVLFVFAGTPE